MKIIILGSNGMLGRYLTNFFDDKYECIKLTRDILDLTSDKKQIFDYLSNVTQENDLIINAAGIIKQRNYSIVEMILVNSVLPNILSEIKTKINCNVIHITTDCVFSGEKGFYDENCTFDAQDDYGRTKILGENPINTNIRTSIIGEELENKRSLIEWVKSNKNGKITGYANHYWNGITCLELCKFIEKIISEKLFWAGTKHIHSFEDVSKFELVKIINDIYNLDIEIEKKEVEKKCFRNLRTIYSQEIKKTIYNQIEEQKKFKLK